MTIFEELVDKIKSDCKQILIRRIDVINSTLLLNISKFVYNILKNERNLNVSFDFSIFDNYKSKFEIRKDDILIISGTVEIDIEVKSFMTYLVDMDNWNKEIIQYKLNEFNK